MKRMQKKQSSRMSVVETDVPMDRQEILLVINLLVDLVLRNQILDCQCEKKDAHRLKTS